MKKAFTCILVLITLTLTLTMTVSAAGFVPSVSYKPAPEVEEILGHDHGECIIVTPVSEAKDSDKISQEKKDELLNQYEILSDPDVDISDKVPDLEKGSVIKDLFDVTIICDDLNEIVKKGPIDVVLKTNVGKDDEIYAIVYADGAWKKIAAKNNGNGTVTISLDTEGIVALVSPANAANVGTPETGDNSGIILWSGILVASLALIAVLLVLNRRIGAKEAE